MTRSLSIFATLLAMLTTFAYSQAARADDPADTNALLTIERNMAAAQNVGEITKYVSNDIVFEDVSPGEVHGIKAFEQDIAAQFAAVSDLKTNILEMTVVASPTVAFAYSIQSYTMKIKASGQPLSGTFRQTDGYRKQNGKWLLVYQHLSVPYDLKTGMAVMHETP
jgi:ketosteroid isomerase-like protein